MKADKHRKRRKLDKNGRRRAGSGSGSESGEEEEDEEGEEVQDGEEGDVVDAETEARAARAAEKAKRMEMPSQTPEAPQRPESGDAQDVPMQEEGRQAVTSERRVPTIGAGICVVSNLAIRYRLQLFRTRLSAVWSSSAWADEDYIPIDELIPLVNEGLSHDEMFGSAQARAVLEKMSEGNEVMLDSGLVYRV